MMMFLKKLVFCLFKCPLPHYFTLTISCWPAQDDEQFILFSAVDSHSGCIHPVLYSYILWAGDSSNAPEISESGGPETLNYPQV